MLPGSHSASVSSSQVVPPAMRTKRAFFGGLALVFFFVVELLSPSYSNNKKIYIKTDKQFF